MRTLALIVAAVLSFYAVTAYGAVNPMKDITAATLPIEVNGTDIRYCSSVVIAPERILTAAHCVTNDVAYPVVRVGGKQLRIMGWEIDQSSRDTAVGIVPGLECPCIPFADASDMFVGQRVLVLGYPGGGPLVVTEGVMVQLSRTVCYDTHDCRPQATTTAPSRGGNSGGPVVVIRDGRALLVGVLVGGIREPGKDPVSTVELLVGRVDPFRR